MNVLLIGSGAREHAIAWKLLQSPLLTRLFVAPGNPGIGRIAATQPLSIPDPATATTRQINAFLRTAVGLAKETKTNLVIIGGEAPLAYGLVDRLRDEAIPVFGPSKAAAEIEWSKAFGKEVCEKARIPTAAWSDFDDFDPAKQFVYDHDDFPGFVIKEDGLAAGKGTTVTPTKDAAVAQLRQLQLSGYFEAGRRVVIEERLSGREVSAHAFTDGETIAHMPFSCDYKRLRDGDHGPITGGMGAYAPAVWLKNSIATLIERNVTELALRQLWAMNRPFRGVIYPGIIFHDQGLKVLEFNARFGDPEAQVLLPLLKTDLLEIMLAVANGTLHEIKIRWSKKAAVAVVLASEGYPEKPVTGRVITGIENIDSDVLVFHAGTKLDNGQLVTAGGRVLTLVATGKTINEARGKVYANVERVNFKGMQYHTDIGLL